jgi:hypothetical protein
MTDNQPHRAKTLKSVGAVLFILFGFAVAVNYYVRVAGPGGRSAGTLVDWIGGKFRSDNSKYYETSAVFCGRAIDILSLHGSDIIANNPEMTKEREKAIKYLRTVLWTTQSVEDEYLEASLEELRQE